MRKTEIYEFYAFGFNYCLIKQEGLKGHLKENAVKMLKNFLGSLKTLHLPVVIRIAEDLEGIIKELNESDGDIIEETRAEEIRGIIEKLDPALDAELQLKEAYIITEKRYPLTSLLDSPKKLLANNVYDSLSDTSRKDFSLACTQIALNQPTAAAFHLMRALEEQVRNLYFCFKKTKRANNPTWGLIISQLRSKRSPKPSENSLTHLDSIRVQYRNPTQHPDTFYSMDEAQDLLNQTVTAINMVNREIDRISK
ncbi:MAG: hypothetical protein ABJQ98_16550 [Alloalcanivorax venustensis]|jgi:hypothetical protein|uniref:hypothetical protein n=1 Tax=Alloalcanivorax venustensis TaxID=172371 RepID=UPI0032997E77